LVGWWRWYGLTPTTAKIDDRKFPGFWAYDGQSEPYSLFAPTGIAVPPLTAGFGNRDRFELNGKIGLHRAQDFIVSVAG
jgi:hypothetical protein